MNCFFRRFFAAAVILLLSSQVFAFDEMNRRIGVLYLKNAAAYYLNGEYDSAEAFLEKTVEFYEESSDYEYIKGLIKLEKTNDLNGAAEYFKKAINLDNWLLLERKDCISDLSLIMFRKKEYSELIKMIENTALPDYNDNDLMYLYLLSLRYSGMKQKYRGLLEISVKRYTDDYRFGLLKAEDNYAYRQRVLDGKTDYQNKAGGLQVFLESVLMMKDSRKKMDYLEQYFDEGGKDISAYLEYYRLKGGPDESQLDFLLNGGVLEDPELLNRLRRSVPRMDLRAKIEQAVKYYTGNIYYDKNDDGYFEELHLYENGTPVGISIDENQDGVIEVIAVFENGKPLELIVENDHSARLTYRNYPYLEEAVFYRENGYDVYTFLRDSLELPVFETRSTDGKLIYNKALTENLLSDKQRLSDNSVRIAVYDGGLTEELERRNEKISILKIYNSMTGNYIYKQSENNRVIGFGDIDFDNLIDLKETYREGKLVSIEADENKNGKYDYKMSFEDGKTTSWWDFNEDGVYDCRQFKENGQLINEYSSALDGVFDIIERN